MEQIKLKTKMMEQIKTKMGWANKWLKQLEQTYNMLKDLGKQLEKELKGTKLKLEDTKVELVKEKEITRNL